MHGIASGNSFSHTHTHTHTHTTVAGEVYSWGKGGRGRLGRETDKDMLNPQPILFEHSSQRVHSLDCSHGTTLLLTVPQL